jgi:transposase
MKKPKANTPQEKTEIEQLRQAELVEVVLGLQKIIQELQEQFS